MDNNKILFSIIVPAYNSAEFIHKCIKSVLAQTYSELELILVDDGSGDDTPIICDTYAQNDPRIKVIHKANGGHTSARNEGLKIAKGEYILFLDSDDWIAPRTLECCYEEIITCRSDILVYRMQSEGNPTPFKVSLPDGSYSITDLENTSQNNFIISEDGSFIFPKSLSAKCFRHNIIYDEQLQIPEDVQVGEDGAAFIASLLKAQSIGVIADNVNACYYCRVRANSVSRSSDSAAFDKAASLLLHYDKILSSTRVDYSDQFNRNVVAQLYTAALLVMRSEGDNKQLNNGLSRAMKNDVILRGFRKAQFNLKGYRFIIKKIILRHRLWGIAKLLDRKNI